MSLQLNRPTSAGYHVASSTPVNSQARTVVPKDMLLVQFTFLLFLTILVEGIFRKWMFPGMHEYFYFLRDPILLCLYAFAIGRSAVKLNGWFALWLGAAIFTSLTSLLVYTLNEIPPALWLLGVRNYFMYIPLAFIVARTFERDDIVRLAKLVAVLAVPIALVCVEQFFSPPGGWLNMGAGGAPPSYFADGLLRTTGLLASDAQQVTYISFSLSVVSAVLVSSKLPKKQTLLLFAGLIAIFTMMMVSGSRSVWFQAAGIGLVTASSFVLTRGRVSEKLRVMILPLALSLLAVAILSTTISGAYKAYEERNLDAGTFSGSTTERIVNMILPKSMFEASIGGTGIGTGTTGAAAYSSGIRAFTLAEGDWDRNFLELGLFLGWIFVGLRIVFAFWLVSISFQAARKGDAMALLLASFAALAIFQSQITMHTVYAHLAWFAAGLTMAAAAPGGARAIGIGTMPPRRSMIGWPAPPNPSFPRPPNWTSGRSRHP
jgi:hypothetical protein